MIEMRLIDANAQLEYYTLSRDGIRYHEYDCDNFPITVELKEVKKSIRNAPIIDAEMVRRGRWIKRNRLSVCSLCGNGRLFEHISGKRYYAKNTSYCPYCGAKMEGAINETLEGNEQLV